MTASNVSELSPSPATPATRRTRTIGIWVLRGLLAALFLFAATLKLTSQPMMVAEFAQIGLGQWFRYLTGALEFAGALMLLVPRVSAPGALLLLCVDLGAFVAQLTVLHKDWIHTVVIGLLLALLAYANRRDAVSAGRNRGSQTVPA